MNRQILNNMSGDILRRVFYLYLIALSAFILPSSVIAQVNEDINNRAIQIIEKAKKQMGFKKDRNPSGFSVSFEERYEAGAQMDQKLRLNFVLPGSVRFEVDSKSPYLTAETVKIFDGKKYYISMLSNHWKAGRGDYKNTIDDLGDKDVRDFKIAIADIVFPYLLNFPFYDANLSYAGVAEAGGVKADVISAVIDNISYQFLFDKDTGLLLMIVKKYEENSVKIIENYYYLDYEKTDGILVPHKIVVDGNTKRAKLHIERKLAKIDFNKEIDKTLFVIK